jgi:transposase InsO family protein
MVEHRKELSAYNALYNFERPHQSLKFLTPAEEYYSEAVAVVKGCKLNFAKPDIKKE